MKGKVDDPGAFCSSLKDRFLGRATWRGKSSESLDTSLHEVQWWRLDNFGKWYKKLDKGTQEDIKGIASQLEALPEFTRIWPVMDLVEVLKKIVTEGITEADTRNLKDQYGNPVPDDLVTMPSIEFLDDESIKLVDSADWYDVETDQGTFLCVSAKAVDYLSEDDIEGYDYKILGVEKVDPPLHRYSDEDGFYHA
jgi:hypothetical protein